MQESRMSLKTRNLKLKDWLMQQKIIAKYAGEKNTHNDINILKLSLKLKKNTIRVNIHIIKKVVNGCMPEQHP